MPVYEYRCNNCRRKVSLFYKTVAQYESAVPLCPRCQSTDLKRLISRVAVLKSDDARMEAMADDTVLSGLDEDDPRALGQFMRKMSHEMGEDMGGEFDEVVDRLERGQSPEEIEESMPALGVGESSMGGDDFE